MLYKRNECAKEAGGIERSQFPKVAFTNDENNNAVLISRHLENLDFLVLADAAVILGIKAAGYSG